MAKVTVCEPKSQKTRRISILSESFRASPVGYKTVQILVMIRDHLFPYHDVPYFFPFPPILPLKLTSICSLYFGKQPLSSRVSIPPVVLFLALRPAPVQTPLSPDHSPPIKRIIEAGGGNHPPQYKTPGNRWILPPSSRSRSPLYSRYSLPDWNTMPIGRNPFFVEVRKENVLNFFIKYQAYFQNSSYYHHMKHIVFLQADFNCSY